MSSAYAVVWRLFLLFLTVTLLVALSYQQPWYRVLDDNRIQVVESLRVEQSAEDSGSDYSWEVALPDQWQAGSVKTHQKIYRFSFDRASGQYNALFLPFAQDQVTLHINGNYLAAHRYAKGRTSWLWNRPLLYRFPDILLTDRNRVEIHVSSTATTRVALGKLYLGPMRLLEDVYSIFWIAKVGVPMAGCVFMLVSALALLFYAPAGGRLYWVAALFNLSAGISMLNWLLVAPPLALHLWYAFSAIFEYLALGFMTLFMAMYLKLQRWMVLLLAVYTGPIIALALGSLLAGNMDSTLYLLERAEVAWAFGGLVLLSVTLWLLCVHDDINDQAIMWGVVLLIAFGLRDSAVHLGLAPLHKGLHIPVGHLFVTLSMFFVFLRTALHYAAELESYRKELNSRVHRHALELNELKEKHRELELTAIAGRLSQVYSHELRNPIGTCLASGNLALKQLGPDQETLREEARQIVTSSMACSELFGQMLATEEGLFPAESQVPLLMPEWLIAHSDALSTAIGARLTVGDSRSVKVLAQPRSLLQAIGLLLSDICDQQAQTSTVQAAVSSTDSRARVLFFFSKPMHVSSADGVPYWTASMASAQALLSVDEANLEVLYDADQLVYACLIEMKTVGKQPSDSLRVA